MNFWDKYKLIGEAKNFNNKFTNNPNKVCRLCGCKYPQVTFNNKPHILPQLFGKNNFVSDFECDSCNSKFQKYESDCSTILIPYIVLNSIKTKNGIPTFQSRTGSSGKASLMKDDRGSKKINFGSNLEDFTYKYDENQLTINFKSKSFCPFNIYKLFLKIGITLMPTELLDENQHYLDCLWAEKPILNGLQNFELYRYMLKGKKFTKPNAMLYRIDNIIYDDREFNEFILIIECANLIWQFFMPLSKANVDSHKNTNDLGIELYPSFAFDDIKSLSKITYHRLDGSITNKITIDDSVDLVYKELHRNQ